MITMIQEITVTAVDVDDVEAGLLGEASPADVFGHDTRHFLDAEGAGRDIVGHGLPGPELALRGDGGRGHGEFAVRLVVGVRDATDVPELQEDTAALGMHGIGDQLPAGDLFIAVDAGGVRVAVAAGADGRGLGDDQSSGRTLRVVFGHQRGRNVGAFGTATRERGHEHTIREREGADLKGRKEGGHTED